MLELSGGLDSRLILAALPEAEKAGNLAVTIDESGGLGGDARVARHIASITGISHREIAVPFAAVEEGDILDRTLRRIVEGYDAMANPIDKLPLALVSDIGDTARFGGQNGEIMRGFYYPLQPLKGKPTTKLIADLVDWRLIANDRTSPNLFAQNFASDALASARASMIAAIAGYGGSWGQVLDRVYLDYRMQSWVGNSAGNRFLDRAVLWPFFDSRFLAAALKLDPDNKRDSRASYRILARLSPQLAATPLDNGLIPAVMAHDNLRAKQMLLRAKARKAQRKLMQRIRPRSVAVLGSERVIDGWFRAKRYAHLDIHRLASLGIFNEAMLEAIGTGRTRPDRATLGFLLLCESWLQP
jgi:asparagine synthase (glutamine-hydrolysing)